MKVKGNILFKEEQQFRTGWVWWILILSMVSSLGVMLGVALKEKEKTRDAWLALVIVIPLGVIIFYLMYITKLQTVITTEGIFYKWWPFQHSYRFVPAAEIEEVELRKGPCLSYGSHWIPGYGRVHNTGLGKGFQFVLKNGKKIFLGTNKQNAFQHAVDKIMSVPKRM